MTAQTSCSTDSNAAQPVPSFCVVSTCHISEMYDRFESGLCDQASCNAVALALSEMRGEKVRVFRKHGLALYQTPTEMGELPGVVYGWLDKVDRGIQPKPFRFEFLAL